MTTSVGSIGLSKISYTSIEPSTELKHFLGTSEVVGEAGHKSEETWKMIRGFYEGASTKASEMAKEKYIESTKEMEIAGVNALCVKPKNSALAHDNKKSFESGSFWPTSNFCTNWNKRCS